MLKSKRTKIIIGALGILAVLITASICVTSIFKKTDVEEFDYNVLAAADSEAQTTLTQIDYIIQEADPYNVLILCDTPSDVDDVKAFFLDGEGFSKYVINNNRTIDAELDSSKINVTVNTAASYRSYADKTAVSDALSNVDLIFMYGKDKNSFTGTNGISEDLYEVLHNYMSAGKPMIMSYYQIKKGQGSSEIVVVEDNGGYDSKVYNLTTSTFKNSWKRTNTSSITDWVYATESGDQEGQLQDIIKTYMSSGRTAYSRFAINNLNIPTGYTDWPSYWQRIDGESKLRVLFIYGGKSDTENLSGEAADIQAVADWMLSDEGYPIAFNTIRSYLPTTAEVNAVRADQLVVSAAGTDANAKNALYVDSIKQYDYIFISPDNYKNDGAASYDDTDMSDEVIAELQNISKGSDPVTYILFGTLVGKNVTTTTTSVNEHEAFTDAIDTSTNFGKLVDLCVTTTGYAKTSNVLPVSPQYMSNVSLAPLPTGPLKNPAKIAEITSLLNKSTFKGHSGSGSGSGSGATSTTAYRVLELQPSYPIDLEIALGSTIKTNVGKFNGYNGGAGNYYTVPANVVNTNELDQLMDENGNITNTEYYQWDLSKAKLAYALGKSVDDIELVQMSTEEFITSKADSADAYDLIYIGGNSSALKPVGAYNVWPNWYLNPSTVDNTTAFSMYTHTGEVAGQVNKWLSAYGATALNGNDITYDRLVSLEKYVDSNMPIVFSNEVWSAYTDAKANGYKNRYIDPDSNMYTLINYAETRKDAGAANVLTNWNIKTKGISANALLSNYWQSTSSGNDAQVQRVENLTGQYGSYAKVTVFNNDLSDDLNDLVYGSTLRPKFTMTNPVEYVDSNSDSKITDHNMKWEITLLNPRDGANYLAVLLQDKDDNAEYDLTSEQLAYSKYDQITGTFAPITYQYPMNDFGAFSWKIVVAEVPNDTVTKIQKEYPARGYAAISMIARTQNQDKKTANILEIMPQDCTASTFGQQDGQDGHTLYLDSAFQQARGSNFLYSTYVDNAFMDENGVYDSSIYYTDAWRKNVIDCTKVPYISGYAPAPKSIDEDSYWSAVDINFAKDGGNFQKTVYMGMYKPNLSLNRYDTDADHEDWTYNYVDLIKDDYILNLDIMYMNDIEYYASETRKLTDTQRENYAKAAAEQKAIYDSYVTEGSVNYNTLKAAEDHMIQTLQTLKAGGSFTVKKFDGSSATFSASDFNLYDVDGIIRSKQYYRFFYFNGSFYYGQNWIQGAAAFYFDSYYPYILEQDKMVNAYRRYRHYNMLAYGPDEYLRANYDVICLGFFDDYILPMVDWSDNALDSLDAFLNASTVVPDAGRADGSLLLTHDTMTRKADSAVKLTNRLRSYVGMDRFGTLTVQSGTDSVVYPHYITSDKSRYFFTNLSTNQDLSKNVADNDASWNSKVTSWLNSRGTLTDWSGSKFGYPGHTDAFVIYETNQAQALPYSFAEFQIQKQVTYNLSYAPLSITGSSKATQVNKGVVTTYPFYIDENLRVSPTHNQSYSLDLENDQITVWYTLAADSIVGSGRSGGSNLDYQSLKENSSLYAASPKDGMDSYFIYSYGNVTYCGAGHCMVTGQDRDNNDERKLFLNVLVNMASRSTKAEVKEESDLVLYDPDGVTEAPGNVVKENPTDGYYIDVDSNIAYPEFGVGFKKEQDETVKSIQLFYDLDFDGTTNPTQDEYVDNEHHVNVVITDEQKAALVAALDKGDVIVFTKEQFPTLIAEQILFDPYGGSYTYLVVRVVVTDKTGADKVLTKRIKIKLGRNLLDLT